MKGAKPIVNTPPKPDEDPVIIAVKMRQQIEIETVKTTGELKLSELEAQTIDENKLVEDANKLRLESTSRRVRAEIELEKTKNKLISRYVIHVKSRHSRHLCRKYNCL